MKVKIAQLNDYARKRDLKVGQTVDVVRKDPSHDP